jgi:hypothetical protein
LNFYITGAAIGSLIMTFIPEFLRTLAEYEPIFTGILLIALVVFFPGGVMSLFYEGFSVENVAVRIRSWGNLPLFHKLLGKE